MKRNLLISGILGLVLAAGFGGWWLGSRSLPSQPDHDSSQHAAARRVLFYRSGMHPWIKSDKPGSCTICGMPLTPVYEGDKGGETSPGMVSLSSNSIQVIHVQTVAAAVRPLERILKVAGVIDDNDATHRRLSAYIEGRIERLNVDSTGSEVVEGQPLATFHSPALLAMEREYLGVLRQLATAPEPVRGEMQALKASAERRLKLVGLSQEQIDSLAQRTEEDHLHVVLSPMTGTVVSREVYAGQYVKAGDKLFEIADFSVMWFKFDAYERDLPWLRVGQEVEVTTPSAPGRILKASIRFIDPNISEMTRTAKVRVELANPLIEENGIQRRELRHRLYAEGRVSVTWPGVLSIPRSSVLNPGGRAVTYIDQGGGYYEQREVKLGRTSDDYVEVLSGVEAGERVVVSGNLLIDSQAQLDGGASAPREPAKMSEPRAEVSPALTPADESALKAFLQVLDRVRAGLTDDDLAAARATILLLPPLAKNLSDSLASRPQWKDEMLEVLRQSSLSPPETVEEARRRFYVMSKQLIPIVQAHRNAGPLENLKIYQCPMTSKAFEGAPKSAQWIQLLGPLANPYMGRAMQDCGTEVHP